MLRSWSKQNEIINDDDEIINLTETITNDLNDECNEEEIERGADFFYEINERET